MLIIPIIAFIFIGSSYFFASRMLPPKLVMKATGWMAGVAFLSYFVTQFIVGVVLGLLMGEAFVNYMLLMFVCSLAGSIAGAWLVLRGFVRRHRLRKADREAQTEAF